MAISRIFDLSTRALTTYRRALDVTAHNIANASNPGFSRQRVNFSAQYADSYAGRTWGAGVNIDQVKRANNILIDSQVRFNMSNHGSNSQSSTILSHIESVFSEPNGVGISDLLTSFFNSWSELSVSPNSVAHRNNVIYAAKQLSQKVQNVYDHLASTKENLKTDFSAEVKTINQLISSIGELNSQIAHASVNGSTPNDLLDKRDVLINELSALINVQVNYDADNSTRISIGGILAVDRSFTTSFKMELMNGKLSMVSNNGDGTASLRNGELFAISESYSKNISGYKDSLDAVMNHLVERVNSLHRGAYTATDPPQTGLDFFTGYQDGILQINTAIINDVMKLAVSADGTSGNGDIALQIAGLSTSKVFNGKTFSDLYSDLLNQIANDKRTADLNMQAGELVLANLQQQKLTYAGVSLDEEMANIIRFQRSYDASARLIKVADEMLKTIIDLV